MSNNSTTIYLLKESPEAAARLAVYIICLILGTFGAIVVLIATLTKKSTRADYHLLLANLAVADLATVWFYVIVHFVILSGNLGPSFCYVWPMMSTPLCASIFTITSIAMLRYRRIVYMWNLKVHKTTMVLWLLCIWLASFALFVPALLVSKPSKRFCYLNWTTVLQKHIYTISLFAIQYVIPLVLIMAAYLGIGCNLKRYEEQVERESIRQENRDIIKTLATVVILFALFLMPLQVGFTMNQFGNDEVKRFTRVFMNYADILCISHACINPFIYGVMLREFRKHYYRWVRTALSRLSNENASYRITTPEQSVPLRNDSRHQLIDARIELHNSCECGV